MTSFKIYTSIFLFFSFFSSIFCDNSGLKFALDTEIFQILKTLPVEQYLKNKTLTPAEGIDFSKGGLLSYHIHIDKLSCTKVINPTNISIKSNLNSLGILLQHIELTFVTNYDISILGILKDKPEQIPVTIILDSIDSNFTFSSGNILFSKLTAQIGSIDIKFSSTFWNILYTIFHGLIVDAVNRNIDFFHTLAQDGINKFISEQFVLDSGFGLKLNLTNIDRPELISKEEKRVLPFLNFLDYTQEKSYRTFLSFGVAGSIVATDASLKPKISPAVEMKYTADIFTNTLSLLLSDYSVNTIMYIAQQSGMIKKNVENNTNSVLPVNITTDGLSVIIPQFKRKYQEEKLVEIKAYVNAMKNMQPRIMTKENETMLYVNFNLEFNVFTSSDPWDDPVKDLAVNATIAMSVDTIIHDDNIDVIIHNANVVDMIILVDNLSVEQSDFTKMITYFSDNIIHAYKAYLLNVNVSKLIEAKTGLKINHLNIINNKEYHTISLNMNDI